MTDPVLSVVVPARRCAGTLEQCLRALLASDLPRSSWELIVVDDDSGDGTLAVATRVADSVVRLEGGAHGPAFARNRGVDRARGEYVVFVDADVCVHADTLSSFHRLFSEQTAVAAAFGAYDDAPPASGLVSQYRNLLHHYTHMKNAGDAVTFWAGCGAVRRDAFRRVGGFDELRFARPQIEDIELGYRLSAHGFRIVLQPVIQGTHLKQWSLWRMLRTDFNDRAVPWMRLLLERGEAIKGGSLNTRNTEKWLTALVGIAALSLGAAAVTRTAGWLLLAAGCLAVVVAGNITLLAWFARRRGVAFAACVVPLHLLHYAVSAMAIVWGSALHVASRVRRNRWPDVARRPA